VGTGDVEGPLRELAADLGIAAHVTFTGRLSEIEKDRRLRQAHLLVHTSLREGWGLNVLEANAVGTPAVVYPVDGLVDATLHEQTGLVTASETPKAVADSIAQLLTSPDKYDVFRINAPRTDEVLPLESGSPSACDWLEDKARGMSA